jgi:penicillin V acylase-like amidase (Ntn superfamily)
MDWDWGNPFETDLWVLPRGIARDGRAGKSSVNWGANRTYGSLVTTVSWGGENGRFTATADGINEKRLAGHLLWLEKAKYGRRNKSRPAINVGLWLQYCLDNFESVEQVKDAMARNEFQLVPLSIQGQKGRLHLAVEDQRGKGGVLEYANGKFEWHYTDVVTNTWTCMLPPANLKRKYFREGERGLPGSTDSEHRLARATWYQKRLPQAESRRQTIAYLMSIMRNVSQPFQRSKSRQTQPSATLWRTICDLTNGYYYFEATTRPNLVWVELDNLDFRKGASPMRFSLSGDGPDPVGDVTSLFKPHRHFEWPSI